LILYVALVGYFGVGSVLQPITVAQQNLLSKNYRWFLIYGSWDIWKHL